MPTLQPHYNQWFKDERGKKAVCSLHQRKEWNGNILVLSIQGK